jgi:ABC-type transporter Mla MlaB component
VFDWSRLRSIDTEACARLSDLLRSWMPQKIDMRWIGGEHLLELLAEAAPTGVRDADPAIWQLRLDALRMANRADQFDEAAIDYCVTYEVSPPSFERVACQVRISNTGNTTAQPAPTQVSDATTSFLESRLSDDGGGPIATFELSGQLIGDIGATLRAMEAGLQSASLVEVSCAKLIRVDFVAAGDLLNWVLSRRGENRSVTFAEAHRLVALFFGAMGIGEHARVKVRTV